MTQLLCFEDVCLGDRWQSPARTITETDIVNFATLTGDFDPLHVDHHYASDTPFRQPIAHGLLGLSIMAGLSLHSPWASTAAFLQLREWKFLKPIYRGDTVHVITEVIDHQPKGRRAGLVIWRRQLLNQNDEVVQEGVLETLVQRQHAVKQKVGKLPNAQAADLPEEPRKAA